MLRVLRLVTLNSICLIPQLERREIILNNLKVEFLLNESHQISQPIDGYYVAYKPITLSCILFMFIEMKFMHCHSCVIFAMKSMSMCND